MPSSCSTIYCSFCLLFTHYLVRYPSGKSHTEPFAVVDLNMAEIYSTLLSILRYVRDLLNTSHLARALILPFYRQHVVIYINRNGHSKSYSFHKVVVLCNVVQLLGNCTNYVIRRSPGFPSSRGSMSHVTCHMVYSRPQLLPNEQGLYHGLLSESPRPRCQPPSSWSLPPLRFSL